jgi:MFS family permease
MRGFADRRRRTFTSLRKHRNYRLFFLGQVVSVAGNWMQDTALPWLVFRTTHSAIDVGMLILCRYAPFAVFGLFAGVFADRFDNRRMMLVTQCTLMCNAAALGALVTWDAAPPLWTVYLLAMVGGAASIFDAPNRLALTYRLVGRDEIPNAVALNSTFFGAGRIIGPATAGVVIGSLGIAACFWLNTASFLALFAALAAMRASEFYPVKRESLQTRGAVREGLRFVFSDRSTAMIIAIAFVVSVTGFNLRVLLPLLAGGTLHGGPETFGLLWAFFSVGAVAGALYSAGAAVASWRSLIAGSLGLAITLLLIAPVHSLVPAYALITALGVAFTVWWASGQSILQLTTPDNLRGRVLGIYVFVITGFVPLGGLLSAWLVDLGGTELAFAVGGACVLVVTLTAAIRVRSGDVGALLARADAALHPADS